MFKNIKDVLIIIVIIVALVFGILFARSCGNNRQHRQDIIELGDRIESLSTGYAKLEEQNNEFRNRNRELEESNRRTREELSSLRSGISEARTSIEIIEGITSPARADIERGESKIQRVIDEIPAVREELKRLRDIFNDY